MSPADNGYPTDLATNDEAVVSVAPKALPVGTYVDHVAWPTDATSPRTKVELEIVDDRGGVSPGAVSFGMTPVHQSAEPQTVVVQNCAAGTLTLAPPVFDPPGEFTALSAVPLTLAAGEQVEVSLAFTPAGGGVRTSTMTIATSSATSPSTSAVPAWATAPPAARRRASMLAAVRRVARSVASSSCSRSRCRSFRGAAADSLASWHVAVAASSQSRSCCARRRSRTATSR